MKHQNEINKQINTNMQSGIVTTNELLAILQNRIDCTQEKDFADFKKEIVEEIEEIKEFLSWVKNQ